MFQPGLHTVHALRELATGRRERTVAVWMAPVSAIQSRKFAKLEAPLPAAKTETRGTMIRA